MHEDIWGDPTRYRYAAAPRTGLSLPLDDSLERAIQEAAEASGSEDQVEFLMVEGQRLTDLRPLARLRGLRELVVHSPVLKDLGPLALLPTLRRLSVTAPVSDLGPLSALTSLTHLDLEQTMVTDLAPLASLAKLRDLSVTQGPLADLGPLRRLGLMRLYVYRTQVTDLTPLADAPLLWVLGINDCPVTDVSVLTQLPSLTHVLMRRTRVKDLGDLPTRAPHITFEGYDEKSPEPTVTPDTPGDPIDPIDPAELLARYRAAEDKERYRLGLRLLGSRDAVAIEALIRELLSDSDRFTMRGLLLDGGHGSIPFPANPWGIPADADLDAAIGHIWAPLADHLPTFLDILRHETLALGLLTDQDGQPSLAYVFVGWNPLPGRVRLDDLSHWREDEGALRIVHGGAPRTDIDPYLVVPVLGGPVPTPLRELWAVHRFLGDGFQAQYDDRLTTNLGAFCSRNLPGFAERNNGAQPDRFVLFASQDYYNAVLDLDILDQAGNPTITTWIDWEIGARQQFWDWFDAELPDTALLGLRREAR
ncbi:Rab family protein [Streptomyces bingchenggensis BCW-1]|uniref:Rab family protein n=1 Tax=Streptomyces bingchenggensis (strain BCW-1) TaxID=749414 RepID=D7BUI6_STRBB|nr:MULTISPECIES: leucine-rich repeat domain-containing protein [Streptomyces]ADI03177.1 Rab family protein [Streptomyces bingchenggensis BCW-1]